MNHPYDDSGLGWVVLVFCGFIAGYVLTKIKVLTDENTTSFCTWASVIVASLLAFGGSWEDTSFIALGGRLAVFALIWFMFGVVFIVGVCMGREKAEKNRGAAPHDGPKEHQEIFANRTLKDQGIRKSESKSISKRWVENLDHPTAMRKNKPE